jgi:hypothetical protein
VTITNPDGQQATGGGLLTVAAPATSTVGGNINTCSGSQTTILAALTGAGPWNLTWSDGVMQNGVPSSPAIRTVSPSQTTSYSVSTVSDACGTGTASGTTTVTVDPTAECGSFFTVTPCRLADTRAGQGPALAANSTRSFPVGGLCTIPADAKAVAVIVATIDQTTPGNVRLFPAGGVAPLASTLNFVANQVRTNNAIIPLGTSGQISVLTTMSTGSTHFILDVNGYIQ